MDKPKPLPSSLRDKKRYIVFKVISLRPPNPEALFEKIYETGLELLGEIGLAMSGMKIMKNLYDAEKRIGIIRCLPGYVEECRLVLASITHVDDVECILNVVGVTGTIRTAKVKYYGD